MTPASAHRGLALTVGPRLFLGLLPSLLAVALVVGLAYWGEYGRAAPGLVVLGAAVLAVVSLAATWDNARYLARRIARLAETAPSPVGERGAADALDRIEQAVDRLGSALSVSESERARADRAAADRLREHATMLAATVHASLAQLDEVRLPLHILLDAKFGDLNENQEELLGAARAAADAMDGALRRLGQVADADRGALPVQRELVQVNDVVRAVLPLARAAAARRGGRVDAALEPGLPRVVADRVRLAEALALLCESAAGATGADRPLAVSTARAQGRVAITIAPSPRAGGAPDDTPSSAGPGGGNVVLALRLLEVQGGSVEESAAAMTIRVG